MSYPFEKALLIFAQESDAVAKQMIWNNLLLTEGHVYFPPTTLTQFELITCKQKFRADQLLMLNSLTGEFWDCIKSTKFLELERLPKFFTSCAVGKNKAHYLAHTSDGHFPVCESVAQLAQTVFAYLSIWHYQEMTNPEKAFEAFTHYHFILSKLITK